MSRLDLTLLTNDGGSWDELAARAGIELDTAADRPYIGRRNVELEVALYWPAVPADLEPERPCRAAKEAI